MATGDSNGTSDRSTAARTPRVLGQEADTWTGNDGVVVALVLVLVVDRKISKNVLTEARVVFVAGDAMTIRFMEGRGCGCFFLCFFVVVLLPCVYTSSWPRLPSSGANSLVLGARANFMRCFMASSTFFSSTFGGGCCCCCCCCCCCSSSSSTFRSSGDGWGTGCLGNEDSFCSVCFTRCTMVFMVACNVFIRFRMLSN